MHFQLVPSSTLVLGWPWTADTHYCRKGASFGARCKFEWR